MTEAYKSRRDTLRFGDDLIAWKRNRKLCEEPGMDSFGKFQIQGYKLRRLAENVEDVSPENFAKIILEHGLENILKVMIEVARERIEEHRKEIDAPLDPSGQLLDQNIQKNMLKNLVYLEKLFRLETLCLNLLFHLNPLLKKES